MSTPQKNSRPQDAYWATVPREEIADQVNGRCTDFFRQLEESGRMRQWRRAVEVHHGLDSDGQWKDSSALRFGGKQGELVLVMANQARALNNHVIVMATGDRPAWDARGINSDYETAAQTQLAEGVLDYYMAEEDVDHVVTRCTEYGVIVSEGYAEVTWDVHKGDDYSTEVVTGPDGMPAMDEGGEPVERVIKTGDVHVDAHPPWMVVRDMTRDPSKGLRWCVVRRWENKWDLAASAGEAERAKILSYGKSREDQFHTEIWGWVEEARSSDDVEVRHFYHERCESLPQGRHAIVVGECVLFDGPLPYPEVPVYEMIPSVEMGSGAGYASSWDLLSLQQISNSAISTVVTNHDAHGVQNILNPEGSNLDPEDLGGGLRVINYNPNAGKPEPLQLVELPASSQFLIEWAKSTMEALSGVNAVARGEDEASSGSHAALLAAQAMQFQSGISRARSRLLQRIGTAIIDRLKAFAESPRVAEIVGKDQRHALAEFTKDDLASVRRVTVVEGNPVSKTLAGRLEMADKLLERGLVKTPEQYFMVLETGRLEPLYEADQAMVMTIKAENEELARGGAPPVLITDMHHLHIAEHLAVLSSPAARKDPRVSDAALVHIQQHIDLRKTMDPILAEITGQKPLASLAAMAGMPQGPGGQPANDNGGAAPGGAPANDNGSPAERMSVAGAPEEMGGSKMPLMPVEPTSGQRAPAPEAA